MTIATRTPTVRRTAGPADAGSFVALVAASVQHLVTAVLNRRAVGELDEMPDYLLKDVGLTRDDVRSALAADWREDPSLTLTLAAARRRRRIER